MMELYVVEVEVSQNGYSKAQGNYLILLHNRIGMHRLIHFEYKCYTITPTNALGIELVCV